MRARGAVRPRWSPRTQVREAAADVERQAAVGDGGLRLTDSCVEVRQECGDSAAAMVVVQPLGQRLCFAQDRQDSREFSELAEHRSQREPDLKALRSRGRRLRQRLEYAERL